MRCLFTASIFPLSSIAEKHGYNIYDALVVSAALEAGYAIVYSEDFHDGRTIDGQLTIRNPSFGSFG